MQKITKHVYMMVKFKDRGGYTLPLAQNKNNIGLNHVPTVIEKQSCVCGGERERGKGSSNYIV